MAPLNYQHQQDRHLEDGLSPHHDEKAALKTKTLPQTQSQPPSPPQSKFRIMNPRRFTVTFGLGLLVGFGLVASSRSRPHRSICSQEIHASTEHEIKALVEQTKDNTSALSDILRCASPETFHRLVSVYFPEQSKPKSDSGRAEAIGHDETWLLTAWEKLVKRQDDGSGEPSTPSGSATDGGAGIVTETTTVTGDGSVSSDPAEQDPTTTDPGSDPATTSSEPPVDTDTVESTSVEIPPSSSTTEELPESTTDVPTSSSALPEETSSSEEPVESTTEAAPETTSTSSEPESTTSEDVPSSSSTSSSSSEPAPTVPQETTTTHEESDRPSKTTIHMSSSAVKETITSVRPDGGTTTITSTSWVAVDPPEQTGDSESDPSLQDAGPSLRANVGPALFVGGLVTMLLMA